MAKRIGTSAPAEVKEKKTLKVDRSGGDAFIPDLGNNNEGIKKLPVVASVGDPITKQFALFAHPTRWCVIEGVVVPQLHELRFVDGADNFTTLRNGLPNIKKTKSIKEDSDWTMINYKYGPQGSYIKKVEARIEGTQETCGIYIPSWAKPISGSKDFRIDTKGYAAWLVKLMEDNELESPDAYIGAKNYEVITATINNMRGKNKNVPEVLLQAEKAWLELSLSGEDYDEYESEVPELDNQGEDE